MSSVVLGAYRLWASIGWLMLLGVAVLSLVSISAPIRFDQGDKLTHLLAYAALMYWWGMVHPHRRLPWAIVLALLGVALEWAQSLTPARIMEWPDGLANMAGVLLALGLLRTPAQRLLIRLDRYLGDRFDPGGA
jgi:VanZ family protein